MMRTDGDKIKARHAPEERRAAAENRQASRNARGDLRQIAELDYRLGIGKGAAKERARLMATVLAS